MPDIKIAKTDHPILEIIKNRWSPRAFTQEIINEEKLNSLFEAARWAASANNEQPWEYFYTTKGSDGWNTLYDCLTEGNRLWAKNATLLIVAVANKTFERNGNENSSAEHDLGLANAHLLLQAVALGFYLHPMAGFYADKVKEALGLHGNKKIVCMIAGGYLGDPKMLDEKNKISETTERQRKPVSSFVKRI